MVKNTGDEVQKIEDLDVVADQNHINSEKPATIPGNVEAQIVKDPSIVEPISKKIEKQNNALILIKEDPQV